MSANKFKVGDRVKVRKGLVADEYYDGVRCDDAMAKMGGEVLTINRVRRNFYEVDKYTFCWSDGMLEPTKKTLHNLCRGDMVCDIDGTRKILAVVDGCYLVSEYKHHGWARAWYTIADLMRLGYKPVETDNSKATIEINGKTYDKAKVEEAIKDLETIE